MCWEGHIQNSKIRCACLGYNDVVVLEEERKTGPEPQVRYVVAGLAGDLLDEIWHWNLARDGVEAAQFFGEAREHAFHPDAVVSGILHFGVVGVQLRIRRKASLF